MKTASSSGSTHVFADDEDEEADEDPDAWYPSQLKGLAVRHVDGRELGTVAGVDYGLWEMSVGAMRDLPSEAASCSATSTTL